MTGPLDDVQAAADAVDLAVENLEMDLWDAAEECVRHAQRLLDRVRRP